MLVRTSYAALPSRWGGCKMRVSKQDLAHKKTNLKKKLEELEKQALNDPLKKNMLVNRVVLALLLAMAVIAGGCVQQTTSSATPAASAPVASPVVPASANASTTASAELVIPVDSPSLPARGFFMGVLPIPADGQSFDDAHAQAAEYSEFVPVWGRPTPFFNLASDLSGSWGQSFVEQEIRGKRMFPIVHLSFMGEGLTLVKPPGMEGATMSDPAWRAAYKQAALDVVRAARPRYLSLGNEVNRWYEKYGASGPDGFKNFVSLYEETYDAVKRLSPETKVFVVFAREIVSENREADLEVLRLFDASKLDLLVFTSYPYSLGRTSPSAIPDDYYSQAAAFMSGKPFGFTEIAWPSLPALGGEQAQADFITQATTRLTRDRGVKLELFGWPWLHDLDENDSVGLIKRNGAEKLAYAVWKSVSKS